MKLINWLLSLFKTKQTQEIPHESEQWPQQKEDNVVNITDRETFLRNEILAMTQGLHLGVKENIPYKNRGPVMDAAIKFMGVELGSSYCISGALYYGVHLMCKKHGLDYGSLKMTASTQSFYAFVSKTIGFSVYWKPKGKLAKKGDMAIQRNKSDSSHGHFYIVSEDEVPKYDDKTGDQKTFEYNTSPTGGSDSIGCFALLRKHAQAGTSSKDYLGCFDVVSYLLDKNPNWKPKV